MRSVGVTAKSRHITEGGAHAILSDSFENPFRAKIDATVNELKEEKSMVADLLPG